MSFTRKEILEPHSCATLVPAVRRSASENPHLHTKAWCYQYADDRNGWRFSIATFGEPGSGKLSLGGFRIVPESRAALTGFDPSREALELAVGMEEKVFWSRLTRVGGPRGLSAIDRIVGGKCVLLPTAGARMGERRDQELLEFAIECCKDFESSSGVFLTTGQDLGHGLMSDGKTTSLRFIHDRFAGSVVADTAKPTAEGNFHMLCGILNGLDIYLRGAKVGLIGVGNIGMHLLDRLTGVGAKIFALEAAAPRRESLKARGIPVFSPEQKEEFLALELDALAVNANGGSLDSTTVQRITSNERLRAITGCENLVMPEPADAAILKGSHRIFTPTEMCGMMGYLTAVEEFLSRKEGAPFAVESMYEPSRRLAEVGQRGTERAVQERFSLSFEECVRAEFASDASLASNG